MSGRSFLSFFVLVFTLALSLPGHAQRRVARVFGADAYQTIRPLDNATEDAQAMAELLRGLEFEVTLELDRTLKQMRRALDDFEADHSGADVALIYYAGHGVEIGGTSMLLPVDIPADSLEALKGGALPLNDLRDVATRMAPAALIIIDACRDDPFGTTTEAKGRSGARLVEKEKAEVHLGMGRMGEAKNTLFVFASAPGMVALDGAEGHSPFTTALTRYFGTPGVEIRSALTLVQQEVYDRTLGRQLPYMESALPALLYIAAETGPDLAERDRLLMAMAGMDAAIRLEVEAIATERGVPLAPLYGAIIAGGLEGADSGTRRARLAEAADSYLAIQELMRTFSASDPEVKALHEAAQELLSVGALNEAMDLAKKAQDIALRALSGIDQIRIERTLSAADSARLIAGIALTQLDYAAAIAAYEQAEALYQSIAGLELPEQARQDRGWSPFELAQVYERAGEADKAIAAYLRMEAYSDEWLATEPENAFALRVRAVAYGSRGTLLLRRGDLTTARRLYEDSSALLFQLLAKDPSNPKLLRDLMVAEVRLGDLLSDLYEFDAAERRYRSAVDQAEFALQREPDSARALSDIVLTLTRLGDFLLKEREDYDQAEEVYLRTRQYLDKRISLVPGDSETERDQMLILAKLGEVSLAREDPGAEAYFSQAEEIARKLLEKDPDYIVHDEDLVYILYSKVGAMLLSQPFQTVLPVLEESMGRAQRLVEADPQDVPRLKRLLTLHLRYVMNFYEIETHMREAIALMRRLEALGAGDPAERAAMEDLLASLDPTFVPEGGSPTAPEPPSSEPPSTPGSVPPPGKAEPPSTPGTIPSAPSAPAATPPPIRVPAAGGVVWWWPSLPQPRQSDRPLLLSRPRPAPANQSLRPNPPLIPAADVAPPRRGKIDQ